MSQMQVESQDPGSTAYDAGPSGHGAPPGRPAERPWFDTRYARRKHPAIACLLSLMPGLGQVYVGHYLRGFIHFLVIAGVITVLAPNGAGRATPLMGFFVAFFWLYNVIDAGRLAGFYNEALAGVTPGELRREMVLPSRDGSIFAGGALLLFGFIILLNRVAGVSLEWVEDWWPVAPIGLGAYLLVKGIQQRRS